MWSKQRTRKFLFLIKKFPSSKYYILAKTNFFSTTASPHNYTYPLQKKKNLYSTAKDKTLNYGKQKYGVGKEFSRKIDLAKQ